MPTVLAKHTVRLLSAISGTVAALTAQACAPGPPAGFHEVIQVGEGTFTLTSSPPGVFPASGAANLEWTPKNRTHVLELHRSTGDVLPINLGTGDTIRAGSFSAVTGWATWPSATREYLVIVGGQYYATDSGRVTIQRSGDDLTGSFRVYLTKTTAARDPDLPGRVEVNGSFSIPKSRDRKRR